MHVFRWPGGNRQSLNRRPKQGFRPRSLFLGNSTDHKNPISDLVSVSRQLWLLCALCSLCELHIIGHMLCYYLTAWRVSIIIQIHPGPCFCGNLDKCDEDTESSHDRFKVSLEHWHHLTITNTHKNNIYSFTVLRFPKITIYLDLTHTTGSKILIDMGQVSTWTTPLIYYL